MRILISPGSTRTAVATIRSLLSRWVNGGPLEVYATYRDLRRVPTEFSRRTNFHAVHGDISDGPSLDFTGCDAVLAITPPVYDGRDLVDHAEKVSKNVKNAIEQASSVKTLVLLSSGGAQFSEGVAEEIFRSTNVENIVYVRCAYFMENWTTNPDTLRNPEPFFFSIITPSDHKNPMVAVSDIGATLGTELMKNGPLPSKPYIFELHGPDNYSPLDVQAAFSESLGRDVKVQLVEKEDLYHFYAQVFPSQILEYWVEMAISILPGGLLAPDKTARSDTRRVYGSTDLKTVVKEAVESLWESS